MIIISSLLELFLTNNPMISDHDNYIPLYKIYLTNNPRL
jgi:hypothetical protein